MEITCPHCGGKFEIFVIEPNTATGMSRLVTISITQETASVVR